MVIIIRSGAFKVMCQHIELKKNTWYYRRRIPTCAQAMHKTAHDAKAPTQVYFSLMTADKVAACKKADAETRRLDALWGGLRNTRSERPNPQVALAVLEARGFKPGDGIRHRDEPPISDFIDELVGRYEPFEELPMVSPQDKLTISILNGAPIPRFMSDAKQKHFDLGKGPRGKVAEGQFNRAWLRLMAITGNIPLDQLRREHANRFAKELDQTGVSGETVRKYVAQIRPLIQTAILEFELHLTNPFEKVTIPTLGDGPRKPRQPYAMDQTRAILERCVHVDDERRWAIAMLSESMCRLSEVIGLRKEDVFLEESVPHIWVRPNELRGLKNKASNRRVPLVGMALWAAKRAIDTQGAYLFPVFLTSGVTKDFSSGSASAALGK